MMPTWLGKALVPALVSLSACGVASVAPIVTNADAYFDARLTGTWADSAGKESAHIEKAGDGYVIEYRDDEGKTGRFGARLGRLGQLRVLDVQPDDPAPGASGLYKSLLVRAHGLVVVDSIGVALVFRIVDGDSLKAFLKREPRAVPHTTDNGILLTGSSGEIRRFLASFVVRPGVLGEQQVWPRRAAGR
jgi:hypothetical protein